MTNAAVIEQLIKNGTGSPVLVTDGDQKVVALNDAAEALLGRRSADAVGKSCFEFLCAKDPFGNRFCHEKCIVNTMAKSGESVRYFEVGLAAIDGEQLGAGVNVLVLKNPGTDEVHIVHFLQPLPKGQEIGAAALQRKTNGHKSEVAPQRITVNGNGHDNGQQPGLSPRETEVLRFLANGKSCQEIATALFISLLTARNHIRNIFRKLDVHSQLEAVAFAHRQGLV